jgi:phospholipase A1
MFMLPYTYSDLYDGVHSEAVFQLSAKQRVLKSRFYFAYTQISFWQVYDTENSSPFRETNYNPEFFYRFKQGSFLSGYYGADLGIEHESNGQRIPLSRSWNLVYFTPYYTRGDILLYFKFRIRIPEKEKEFPEAAEGDDNPDIMDFYGYSDFHLYFRFWRDHTVHLMLRGNISSGRGGMSLFYSIPIPNSEGIFVGIRFSHGYGESMVDYNRSITRIGAGIMLSR